MPRTNTTVFATTAGPSPGLGLTRNAGSCSRPGGSAAAGAGPRDDTGRARLPSGRGLALSENPPSATRERFAS